jgi:hypothetical protein
MKIVFIIRSVCVSSYGQSLVSHSLVTRVLLQHLIMYISLANPTQSPHTQSYTLTIRAILAGALSFL